jgi:hypothetical protein
MNTCQIALHRGKLITRYHCKTPQDRQKAKGEQKRKKGKRTNNSYCLFPQNSQKLNKNGKTFSSRCGVYLGISRKDKSMKQKTKAGESEEKDKTFSAMWKKTKAFYKSSPFSLHFCRC